jgi:hypothetical protein
MPFANDLEELARMCMMYDQAMQDWKEVFPGWILEVDYADVMNSPQEVAKRISEHCQVHVPQEGLESVQGMFPGEEVGVWQRYAEYLEPARKVLEGAKDEEPSSLATA